MRRHVVGLGILLGLALLLVGTQRAAAQNNNNQNNNNNTLGMAGVEVDAQGVLQKRTFSDPDGTVWRQRVAAAKSSLSRDLIPFSKLRKVSLTRLEKAILDKGGVVTDEMRQLAGLLRVRYVFFYPETKDIVLAGPAEGWVPDASGRVVGISSARPVLQLQDLVVALRAFAPGASPTESIGCSIDPTPEGLAALQKFVKDFGSAYAPGQEQVVLPRFVNGLRSSLGMQNVSVHGISPKTHFAQVLVEADYRMKLIGIGLERPPVRMVSFIEKVNPSAVSRNALFRWYFVPDYSCVRVSEDGMGMELVGDGVKLVGEDEMVTSGGQRRTAAGRSNFASQAFVTSFTQKYSALADRSPVYAELRNLIDLAVTSAFIQKQDYYAKAGWKMELFGSEQKFPVETLNAPKHVQSTVGSAFRGGRFMAPIAGGVQIEPLTAVKADHVLSDEDGKVAKLQAELKPELAPGQWWWD